MSKPRAGRINIAQKLLRHLDLQVPASTQAVIKALKEEEARTLRICSLVLRKAAKHREGATSDLRRGEANVLHEYADKFLHEAQALEKTIG